MLFRTLVFFISFFISSQTFADQSRRGPTENVGGFVAGTLVHTFSGPDTIQNIRINDRLLSFSTETGQVVHSRVTEIHRFQVDEIVKIVISGETFYLNPDHRFYLPESKNWISARDIEIGSHLLNKSGEQLLVESKEAIRGREWLYDLTVEDTENYFVGRNQVLVHNFVFIIPIAAWVIGEGLVWASIATIAVVVGTAVLATELSRKSSNKQTGTIEGHVGDEPTINGKSTRVDTQREGRHSDCESRRGKVSSPGQMQQEVSRGQSPKTVERVDKGRGPHEQDHVHFSDKSALNKDGSWKHGGKKLSNDEKKWLSKHNWKQPQ